MVLGYTRRLQPQASTLGDALGDADGAQDHSFAGATPDTVAPPSGSRFRRHKDKAFIGAALLAGVGFIAYRHVETAHQGVITVRTTQGHAPVKLMSSVAADKAQPRQIALNKHLVTLPAFPSSSSPNPSVPRAPVPVFAPVPASSVLPKTSHMVATSSQPPLAPPHTMLPLVAPQPSAAKADVSQHPVMVEKPTAAAPQAPAVPARGPVKVEPLPPPSHPALAASPPAVAGSTTVVAASGFTAPGFTAPVSTAPLPTSPVSPSIASTTIQPVTKAIPSAPVVWTAPSPSRTLTTDSTFQSDLAQQQPLLPPVRLSGTPPDRKAGLPGAPHLTGSAVGVAPVQYDALAASLARQKTLISSLSAENKALASRFSALSADVATLKANLSAKPVAVTPIAPHRDIIPVAKVPQAPHRASLVRPSPVHHVARAPSTDVPLRIVDEPAAPARVSRPVRRDAQAGSYPKVEILGTSGNKAVIRVNGVETVVVPGSVVPREGTVRSISPSGTIDWTR